MKLSRAAAIGSLILFAVQTALPQTQNAAQQQQSAQELKAKRDSCPVTRVPQPLFTPKGSELEQNEFHFYFGTPKLSVLLTQIWTVRQQVRWFSDDAPSVGPVNLKITGRRLDPDVAFSANPNLRDSAPTFIQNPTITTRKTLMLSSVAFPTAGCWEITARMNDTELRFVTYITD
jgi:hypothetical protein